MSASARDLEVLADWAALGGPRLMGTLRAQAVRGREVLSFEFSPDWLGSGAARMLDPALRLVAGRQYPPAGFPTFGVFADASPDRWGRVLLQRREALRAKEAGRKPRTLSESDFLLGVFDGHRLGALRFRLPGGPFLDDDMTLASPPWTSLRELERVSRALEREGAEAHPSYARWLRLLVAPGRSLGGARPKASVIDDTGHLWIAKFPSERDTHDVGAWEAVAHRLAKRAGLDVPEARVEQFGRRHHTFLTRRFDRTGTGARLHFASAMTLLQRRDGEEGASYLELVGELLRQGSDVNASLEQLWRRVAFSVCISNADDHLRNHGFLLEGGRRAGWRLAPAYDLNPVPGASGLSLNITEHDNALDLGLVRELAVHCRLKPARAEAVLGEIRAAVRQWRREARALGLSRPEQDALAPAFERA